MVSPITDLLALKPYAEDFSALGEEYIFSHFASKEIVDRIPKGPIKINGMVCMVMMGGTVHMDVNLTHCRLSPGTVLVAHKDSLLHFCEIENDEFDCYLLYVSEEFLHDTNIDLNIFQRTLNSRFFEYPPYITLSKDEASLMHRYMELLHANTVINSDPMYVRSISQCIVAALFYQFMQIVARQPKIAEEERLVKKSRQLAYAIEFMKLLNIHHRKERSLTFYASRLFITPKYLSLTLRKITGKSATQWIDDYVILEAKNMLRYADKSIQQISLELNFPDQSTFGKYFKHCTGMSPSKYQKS